MTAEQYVKQFYPTARAERQITNGGNKYWLIRMAGATMYFSDGKSESNAWVNAKQRIINEKTI